MTTLAQLLQNILDVEARAGFPNLRGAAVTGRIPVTQSLVNEILAGIWDKFAVELEPDNRVRVRLFGLPTPLSATLVGVDSSLTVTLRLDGFSKSVLWFARLKTPPYTRLSGGDMFIDAGQVPEIAAWRHIWRYASINLATSPQRLDIDFKLKVN